MGQKVGLRRFLSWYHLLLNELRHTVSISTYGAISICIARHLEMLVLILRVNECWLLEETCLGQCLGMGKALHAVGRRWSWLLHELGREHGLVLLLSLRVELLHLPLELLELHLLELVESGKGNLGLL